MPQFLQILSLVEKQLLDFKTASSLATTTLAAWGSVSSPRHLSYSALLGAGRALCAPLSALQEEDAKLGPS